MVSAAIVAQLVPAKRHVDFIHAMAEVAKQYPQARFLIVGADPHPRGEYGQSLQNLVDCLGLGEQIHFIGFCADMAAIMAGLDVVVLTSASRSIRPGAGRGYVLRFAGCGRCPAQIGRRRGVEARVGSGCRGQCTRVQYGTHD